MNDKPYIEPIDEERLGPFEMKPSVDGTGYTREKQELTTPSGNRLQAETVEVRREANMLLGIPLSSAVLPSRSKVLHGELVCRDGNRLPLKTLDEVRRLANDLENRGEHLAIALNRDALSIPWASMPFFPLGAGVGLMSEGIGRLLEHQKPDEPAEPESKEPKEKYISSLISESLDSEGKGSLYGHVGDEVTIDPKRNQTPILIDQACSQGEIPPPDATPDTRDRSGPQGKGDRDKGQAMS